MKKLKSVFMLCVVDITRHSKFHRRAIHVLSSCAVASGTISTWLMQCAAFAKLSFRHMNMSPCCSSPSEKRFHTHI